MDHASGVGGVEGLGYLQPEGDGAVHWRRALGELIGERPAFEKFHDEERHAVLFANVEERADVRVIEARDGAGLARQAIESARVRERPGGEDLHGHIAVEPRIAGAIHFAHAAGTQ